MSSVMAVKGEDPSFGDHHQARSVHDIDLIEMLRAIQDLRGGRDMAGIELAGAPDFMVGSTIDAGAKGKSPDLEVEEMMKRFEAGARFFITPPLFDTAAIEPFLKRIKRPEIIIIPTVLLLKSLGMARYISRNMPHIYIPDALIERLQRSPDKVRECLQIASELVVTLKKEGFRGVFLSTIGWEHKLPEIIEAI
jgi:5,10-methylenetetrahydrofolate reductase